MIGINLSDLKHKASITRNIDRSFSAMKCAVEPSSLEVIETFF